jgi:hypothetical protein
MVRYEGTKGPGTARIRYRVLITGVTSAAMKVQPPFAHTSRCMWIPSSGRNCFGDRLIYDPGPAGLYWRRFYASVTE